jgi:hypothetical protein
MTAPALLVELNRRGVRLELSGGRLRFDAPRGAMADLLPDVARFRVALVELLAAPPEPPRPAPAPTWRDVPAAAIDRATRRIRIASCMTAAELHHCALIMACLEHGIEPPESEVITNQ